MYTIWFNIFRVYEGYPYLLAEMYAYSMAAAHERLPHLQVSFLTTCAYLDILWVL